MGRFVISGGWSTTPSPQSMPLLSSVKTPDCEGRCSRRVLIFEVIKTLKHFIMCT